MTKTRHGLKTVSVAVFLAAVSCAVAGAAELPSDLELETVDDGFVDPVVVTGSGDGSGRLFVVEQAGRIKIVGGATFLDISSRVDSGGNEQGLLGLAFHPDYANNGFFYVNYTHDPGPGSDVTRVSRFSVSDDDDVADPGSEVVVLTIPQDSGNHNGGDVHFGPDGYLYIATGDGGGAEDPNDRGQSLATLLGKLLRIDVDTGNPYGIPQSNPFVGVNGALAEIWAYGLRNPWRFSFDRATGDLYIGDVGQYDIEEIDLQPASSSGGENYGWSCMEGDVVRNYNPCDDAPLTAPILVYDHGLGCSVTGGFVYRGKIGGLNGLYVFADYCTGKIWFAEPGAGGWTVDEWGNAGFGLSSFGEGDDGELYLANRSSGVISRFFSPRAISTDGFEFGDFSRWSSVVGD